MAAYTGEFKRSIVRKALLHGPEAAAVAEEAGISLPSLCNLVKKAEEEGGNPHGNRCRNG